MSSFCAHLLLSKNKNQSQTVIRENLRKALWYKKGLYKINIDEFNTGLQGKIPNSNWRN